MVNEYTGGGGLEDVAYLASIAGLPSARRRLKLLLDRVRKVIWSLMFVLWRLAAGRSS